MTVPYHRKIYQTTCRTLSPQQGAYVMRALVEKAICRNTDCVSINCTLYVFNHYKLYKAPLFIHQSFYLCIDAYTHLKCVCFKAFLYELYKHTCIYYVKAYNIIICAHMNPYGACRCLVGFWCQCIGRYNTDLR